MKPKFIAGLLLSFIFARSNAQYVFLIPTHYHGIFSDQLSSARAQGMGYTTITLEGVSTAIYNPATISPGNTCLDLSLNYAKGNPQMPKSFYPFVGVSFKPMPRLAVGASMFAWIDPDSYWDASIQGQSIPTEKKTQHLYSVTAAYEVIRNLHVGISGNFLRDEAVKGTTTNKEFMLNAGVIYDRPVQLLKIKNISNQQIRFAASLVNATMNGATKETYQNLLNYRDLPIIARGGLAYNFSLPLSASFTRGKKFFQQSPELLDLAVRLQYQDWLHQKDQSYDDDKFSTAFGIGAEAWFMKLLALRLGYYSETRPDKAPNPNDLIATRPQKSGLTWGLGVNLPVQRLTNGELPLDIEVNLVTQRMMNEMNDKDLPPSSDFRDKRFQFCIGIDVKWKRKQKAN
jgi:hypothetical protein